MMTRFEAAAMVVLAALVVPAVAAARGTKQPGDGVPESIHYYETAARMSPFEVASDQSAGGAGVKTADISFYTLGRQFDLKLEEHSPFAPGGTVHWVDDTGEVVEPAKSNGQFFSGRVEGDPHSWVRIAMRGNALAGVISTDDELYFLEPASRFFGDGVADETLAYRLSDTDSEWEPGSCGAIDPPTHHQPASQASSGASSAHRSMHEVLGRAVTAAAGDTLQRAQIGMVADFLYFSKHGADSASDIAEIINNVDGIYQAEVGVTIQILTTVVFTTQGSDPFFSTGVDANALLTAFSNWKDANDNNSSQMLWHTDIAHLLTGRDVNGACPQSGGCPNNCCVIGYSFIGSLCDSADGVGIDQDFTTALNLLTVLLAHEMGHNFGAFHDAQANNSCPCCASSPGTFIMNPVLTSSLQHKFSDCSKSFMNPEINAAGCFDTVTVQPPPPPTLDPLASAIIVGGPLTLTGSGFTAGSVIDVFVATATGVASNGPYTPSSQTSTTLTFNQISPSLALGDGFATIVVVNTDQSFTQSNPESEYILGNASLGIPSIAAINGVALRAFDSTVPVANVETAVVQGSTVTITGSGFNAGALVNLFSATGPLGPLTPLAGATSTSLKVTIPADAPTGPGALQVIDSPYSGNVISNAVSVPIGAPLTLSGVTQNGTTVDVQGTGFSVLSVINLFNSQPGGVVNLGGYGAGGSPNIPLTVVSGTELTFTVPAGAVSGPAYVQILNPPYIPFSSTGGDPDGGFSIVGN